jgi:hypothetical protein
VSFAPLNVPNDHAEMLGVVCLTSTVMAVVATPDGERCFSVMERFSSRPQKNHEAGEKP